MVACERMALNHHAHAYSLVTIQNAVYLSKSEIHVCLQTSILWYTYLLLLFSFACWLVGFGGFLFWFGFWHVAC